MKIIHVVGARPNFMKIAPIIDAFKAYNEQVESHQKVTQLLVHTGQHYDHKMSQLFFDELGMPKPDINLHIGSGPHGQQTGRIMEKFEEVLLEHKPDLVLVAGDVNSTLACTIDAKKLCIPVAHVESGLRSYDETMPEEINRLATDVLSDLLFTTDYIANENLEKEGADKNKVHLVGNVMIDSLVKHKEKALKTKILETLSLQDESGKKPYAVVTLHRPGNVDNPAILQDIGEALVELGKKMRVLFPAHPRTQGKIKEFGLEELFSAKHNFTILEPLGYLEFLNLTANASLIVTDSGGIQEESTILKVPCITVRPNTERPITIEQGTNRLIGNNKEALIQAFEATENQSTDKIPELWDGHTSERIVEVIINWLKSR